MFGVRLVAHNNEACEPAIEPVWDLGSYDNDNHGNDSNNSNNNHNNNTNNNNILIIRNTMMITMNLGVMQEAGDSKF